MKNETMPNTFIIGAPKCGTTSLASWLSMHPAIYVSPVKEPFYFASDVKNQWVQTWDGYRRLFAEVKPSHSIVMEASTTYLFSKVAVPKIEELFPTARYIVMLRNPVDMAYSLHQQQIRSFNETVKDFRQAWHLASERRARRQVPVGCKDPILLDYPAWCLLGEQLERLFNLVSKDRVLIIWLDDMKKDPRREYLRVLDFLNVADDNRKTFPVRNPARTWRSPWVGKTIRILAKCIAWSKHVAHILPKRSFGIVDSLQKINARQQSRTPIPSDLRVELEDYFASDLSLLERLVENTTQIVRD